MAMKIEELEQELESLQQEIDAAQGTIDTYQAEHSYPIVPRVIAKACPKCKAKPYDFCTARFRWGPAPTHDERVSLIDEDLTKYREEKSRYEKELLDLNGTLDKLHDKRRELKSKIRDEQERIEFLDKVHPANNGQQSELMVLQDGRYLTIQQARNMLGAYIGMRVPSLDMVENLMDQGVDVTIVRGHSRDCGPFWYY